MDPLDSVAAIESSLFHLEGIYGGMTTPVFRLYESVRRGGVVVTLDGHGADELLGGYDFFVRDALRDCYWPPRNWRNFPAALSMLPGMYGSGAQLNRYRALLLAVLGSVPGADRLPGILSRARGAARGNPWLGPLLRETAPAPPVAYPDGNIAGHLNRSLYRSFHATVLPAILRNFDRMSMAHGVEVRMPFMDWRLVTFAFSLPAESKIGGGFTKRVLRHALRDVLPPAIRDRKDKIGFNAPMVDWFRGPMREWMEDLLRSAAFRECPAVDPAAIRGYYDARSRDGSWQWGDTYRFWPYINAFLWLERFARRRDAR
jgi:asparagine synthase (glutamine-hydrolysing)